MNQFWPDVPTYGEEKLALFLNDLHNYHPNIKLTLLMSNANPNITHESNKDYISFLDLT